MAATTEAHKLDKLSKEAREMKIQEWKERNRNVEMAFSPSNITLNGSSRVTPDRLLHNVCSPNHEDSIANSQRERDAPKPHRPKPMPSGASPIKGVADFLKDTDLTRSNHRRSVSTVTV